MSKPDLSIRKQQRHIQSARPLIRVTILLVYIACQYPKFKESR